MHSVERYLSSVKNLRTKARILNLLRQRNAAKSNYGLMYRHGAFQLVLIY